MLVARLRTFVHKNGKEQPRMVLKGLRYTLYLSQSNNVQTKPCLLLLSNAETPLPR